MKKILLLSLLILILFHSVLYLQTFRYQNPERTFEFFDVTGTDIAGGKTDYSAASPEIQNFFINPDLEDLLCQCKFKSVNLLQAATIAAQSKKANQIGILITSGERSLFQNKEYVNGKLLFFDDDRVYYAVMYLQDDMRFSATGWTYTVYEIDTTQSLLAQYHDYLRDVPKVNLLYNAASNSLLEYKIQLKKPLSVVFHSIMIIIIFAFFCIENKKRRLLSMNE